MLSTAACGVLFRGRNIEGCCDFNVSLTKTA
nr:MAG TPA: hypothetical protein [Caudoviricetes sp.]